LEKARKVLSVIIPAYNSQKTIKKCIDSFICDYMNKIEIIIVNDGSSDKTLDISKVYVEKYPDIFLVIDKKNGGHGSAINVGTEKASGKFLKIVDSDDWVDRDGLVNLLRVLENNDSDIVLTNFHTVSLIDGQKKAWVTEGIAFERSYSIKSFMKHRKSSRRCCNFHGVIYCTDFYRKCEMKLAENVFYEDQEYATIPFKFAETILPLNIFLYQYSIDNSNQSTSDENLVMNLEMIENSFWRLYGTLETADSNSVRKYYFYKLREILLSYYTTSLIKNRSRKEGRCNANTLYKKVRKEDEKLSMFSFWQYWINLALHLLGVNGSTYVAIKKMKVYNILKDIMH